MNREISSRVMASIELMTLSTIISIVVGVGLGVYTAQRQYQLPDRVWSGIASVFMVIPTVVLAILVVFFAIEINMATGYRIFYVTGLSSYDGENVLLALVDFLQHIFLPTVVLTIISAVGYHLTQRTYLWTRCTQTTCAPLVQRVSPASRRYAGMPYARRSSRRL